MTRFYFCEFRGKEFFNSHSPYHSLGLSLVILKPLDISPTILRDVRRQETRSVGDTVRYDDTSGELTVITFTEPLPSESSLKYLLAEERTKHSVRRLTFVFSNIRAEEHIHWLKKKGFERSDSRYCAGSMISFSKTYPIKK